MVDGSAAVQGVPFEHEEAVVPDDVLAPEGQGDGVVAAGAPGPGGPVDDDLVVLDLVHVEGVVNTKLVGEAELEAMGALVPLQARAGAQTQPVPRTRFGIEVVDLLQVFLAKPQSEEGLPGGGNHLELASILEPLDEFVLGRGFLRRGERRGQEQEQEWNENDLHGSSLPRDSAVSTSQASTGLAGRPSSMPVSHLRSPTPTHKWEKMLKPLKSKMIRREDLVTDIPKGLDQERGSSYCAAVCGIRRGTLRPGLEAASARPRSWA